jgi:hypothetical protein
MPRHLLDRRLNPPRELEDEIGERLDLIPLLTSRS